MTENDLLLVLVALEICDQNESAAIRLLRDECGWTVLNSRNKIQFVQRFADRLLRGEQGSFKPNDRLDALDGKDTA